MTTHFKGPVESELGFISGHNDSTIYVEDYPTSLVPSDKEYVRLSGKSRDGQKEKFSFSKFSVDPSDYFTFYSSNGDYINAWFSVDAVGSSPSLGGIEVEIALVAGDIGLIATWTKAKAALDALAYGWAIDGLTSSRMHVEQDIIGDFAGTYGLPDGNITVGFADAVSSVPQRGTGVEGPYQIRLEGPFINPGLSIGQRLLIEVAEGSLSFGQTTPTIIPVTEWIWNGSSWLTISAGTGQFGN